MTIITTEQINNAKRTYKTGIRATLNKEDLFDLPTDELLNLMCVVLDKTNGNYIFDEFIGDDEETLKINEELSKKIEERNEENRKKSISA